MDPPQANKAVGKATVAGEFRPFRGTPTYLVHALYWPATYRKWRHFISTKAMLLINRTCLLKPRISIIINNNKKHLLCGHRATSAIIADASPRVKNTTVIRIPYSIQYHVNPRQSHPNGFAARHHLAKAPIIIPPCLFSFSLLRAFIRHSRSDRTRLDMLSMSFVLSFSTVVIVFPIGSMASSLTPVLFL